MIYKDFIIPLAWPEAPVRTAGGPYDKFLGKFSLYRNGYYKAGHAAFLLINHKTGDVDYFDFGRYISPNKYGRARSKETDPEVAFKIKAKIVDGEIVNFNEIIKEIGSHPQTHGDGTLYAGVQKGINHQKAIDFIEGIQEAPYTPYGPFVYRGTNCSRFVAQTMAYAKKGSGMKFKYPWYSTPAPLGNIFYSNVKKLFKLEENGSVVELFVKGEAKQFTFMKEIMMFKKGEITPDPNLAALNKIDAPNDRKHVSDNAQWLGGTGAGAWYEILNQTDAGIVVKRTQGNGHVDFSHSYKTSENDFDLNQAYKFEYGSHGAKVLISQNGKTFTFVRL